MARDNTIPIRRGMMTIMEADAQLLAITSRIYPQATPASPAYPFVRMGAPSVVPIRGACVDGGTWTVAVHGFATGVPTETAEDRAGRLGAAIATALDGKLITLGDGEARIRWRGSQLLMDPDESDCFHTVQNFVVRAITG
jgi:hypothetical protein